ncbi:nucleotide kinase domain-containing protein [Methylobacterium sp. V23]|uniref:nucleotide kinase domain-containing protein n=1 Tax=Methylobacterium sp. V23 TaxID=2044878 RepID=UPI001FE0D21C|nr:nucleotide kinase domain-containing protein [Methylobacterium sp. V23]
MYEIYWTFAARRHEAFERRVAGEPGPWTSDPILNTYKFCNVFRAADRVSQYMIRSVAYADDAGSYADRVFQIVAFRTFSNIATWEGVRAVLGGAPRLEDLTSGRFEQALDRVKASNGGLYTGAFILCANKAYGFDEKHRNHVALFKHMFGGGRLHEAVRGANSLEGIVRTLEGFPLMGPFMAYQTAVDLNYSDLLGFSEDDYTQAGPGALRGLRKAFHSLGDYTSSDAIQWMVEQQDAEFERLGLAFRGLFGRRLHAIDCQGLFCELDKYCREAVPELASNRSRIKARFTASSQKIELFFPPKWRLDLPSGSTVPPTICTAVAPQIALELDAGRSREALEPDRRYSKRGPRRERARGSDSDVTRPPMLL